MADLTSCGPILVVGGCGFLGRNLVLNLIQNDKVLAPSIHILDLAEPGKNRLSGVNYHQVDLNKPSSLDAALSKARPAVVFHTASPRPYLHDLDFFIKVNVEGTRNLLDACLKVGTVKSFVYTSSSSVIHDLVHDLIDADETYPLVFMPQQRQPYHHTKAKAECLVLEYNRRDGRMLTTSLRPSGIFGPGDEQSIATMVESAKIGRFSNQIGDGRNEADWTYVDNVARAHSLAAERLLEASEASQPVANDLRVEGEAFTITNDQHYKFWDFVRAVGAAAGYPTKPESIRVIPRNVGLTLAFITQWFVWLFSLGTKTTSFNVVNINHSTLNRTFDISKAKKRLGYRPEISIDEGIKRAVAPLLAEDQKSK